MINVPDAVKNKFKNGSSQKDFTISYDGVGYINYCDTDGETETSGTINNSASISTVSYNANVIQFPKKRYVCFSIYYKITALTQAALENIELKIEFVRDYYTVATKEFIISPSVMSNYLRIYAVFDIQNTGYENPLDVNFILTVLGTTTNNTTITVLTKEAKIELFDYENVIPTNYSEYLVNDKYVDITNDNLIGQSFSLTEALCTEDNLKFGVCEASYIEFECFNINNDFKNEEIKTDIQVSGIYNLDGVNLYYGYLNPGTGGYLIANSFNKIIPVPANTIHNENNYSTYKKYIVISFKMKNRKEFAETTFPVYMKKTNLEYVEIGNITLGSIDADYVSYSFYYDTESNLPSSKIYGISGVYIKNTSSSNKIFDFEFLDIKIETSDETTPTTYSACPSSNNLDFYNYVTYDNTLPLGCYIVKNITKQSNKKRTKITAYDKSTLLDVNAEDWYSSYMFGVDFSEHTESGFQFPRQIYSTYWNIAHYLNIEYDEYDKTLLTSKTREELTELLDTDIFVMWLNADEDKYYKIKYSKILSIDVDYTKLHQIYTYSTNTYDIDFSTLADYNYTNRINALGIGFNTKGTVLIEELNASNVIINSFCCDSGDYFKLSDTTIKINLYVPYGLYDDIEVKVNDAVKYVSVYEVDNSIYLINGATKLVYYNYATKDIFASPSGITARQVVQSLLEVCGCFFMINRYGYPSFVYCTKTSLYPADTLYPEDTLLPRGSDETTTKSLYEKFYFEDYTVLDYGKIQIKKNSSDNATSICEWEYVGDADKENTYIIEDNVFYCSDSMIYDFDNMPEVYEMLVNMFSVISNMSYIPHETVCKGLPYLEVGDRISLLTDTGGIETFIFRRTLNGIQSLKDNYSAVGDEKTDAISSYGYTLWGG